MASSRKESGGDLEICQRVVNVIPNNKLNQNKNQGKYITIYKME